MSRDEKDMVEVINTLRHEIKETEIRLAKTEGTLETTREAFAATEKKLRALGYEPSRDVGAAIQGKLDVLRLTLSSARQLLDDAEEALAGTLES